MNKIFGAGLACLMVIHSAFADVTRVQATIDKNPVMVDEAIQLVVVAEGDPAREAFDSSPLLKDFVVGRTSVSSQTRIINFDKEETVTWTTTLFPRGEGNFTIPALTIEGKKTQPIVVNVIPVQSGSNEPARDYYVTTSADATDVYLQQQIFYTAKLYLSNNIERGSLQAPELENGQIQQLGDDKQYTDIVNGKRYQVIERNFAIVPQSSGNLTIHGPVFAGEVLAQDPNARFGFFNRTKQINRLGPDITINVKPIPSAIDYHWLPSEYVSISEEWPQQENFTVGEPVTRTITLTAMGVVEEQLPELPSMYPPGFKLYPDQATTTTLTRNNHLIAQRVENVAMIPSKAGDFVLPEVTVPWFNVQSGNTEYATLPARTIEVAAGTGNALGAAATPTAQATSQPASVSVDMPQSSHITPQQTSVSIWWFIMAGLWLFSLAGWLVTVLYFRRQLATKNTVASRIQRHPISADENVAFNNLNKVITSGAPGQVQQALRTWIKIRVSSEPGVRSVEQFIHKFGLQPQINAMLSCQYGEREEQWDRKALLQSVQAIRQNITKQQSATLPPLYPEGQSS